MTKVRVWSAGVTAAVSASDFELIKGVGPQGAGAGLWIADLS